MFESQYLTLISKITTMFLGIYLIWFLFVQYSPFGFVSKHILPHLISKSTTCNISKCLHSMYHITHWDPMGLCLLLFPVIGFTQKKSCVLRGIRKAGFEKTTQTVIKPNYAERSGGETTAQGVILHESRCGINCYYTRAD